MKGTLLLSISSMLISMMFFSCQQSDSEETILSGTINGFAADSVEITYYKNDTWESGKNLWIPLDSAGQFTVSLPVNSLKEFRILQSMFVLKTGWKTTMNIYMNEEGTTDSTTFDGDGAEENEVYNKNLALIFGTVDERNKEPGEFIDFMDSINLELKADVDGLQDADREFVNMLRTNLAYHMMDWWEGYAMGKFDYAGIERPDSLKSYSSRFDQLIVFDKAELLNSFIYKNWLDGYFRKMLRKGVDFDALREANEGDGEKARRDYNKKTFNLMLNLADSIISDKHIKSYVYFIAFNNALSRNIDLCFIELVKQSFTDRFEEVVEDTSMTNYIAKKIARLEKLSPGMPAPAFSFPDITGTQISLADFKGKYVYIDVWATWCGPCLRQIPKLKELEQEFGDEIAFLSISIDHDKEIWHKYVKEKALTGVQILSLPQKGIISSSSEIMELHTIEGIPRFIMIDPDGNLIDANASRPSDEKTRKIFEEWTNRNAVDI